VAGLLKYGADGARTVACVLTGNGLKDPQTALDQDFSVIPCDAELDALEQAVLR
jgi:threonine synthase